MTDGRGGGEGGGDSCGEAGSGGRTTGNERGVARAGVDDTDGFVEVFGAESKGSVIAKRRRLRSGVARLVEGTGGGETRKSSGLKARWAGVEGLREGDVKEGRVREKRGV